MGMYEIIQKKRDGGILSRSDIDYWINGYVQGSIPDYQSAALLMAIFFRGLNLDETTDLTKSMLESGKVTDLSGIPGIKVDKHSTGGVGDKTTLVLGPLVSSAGVKVAKMSGRGLGHTGGTIDKLESIPGFKVELSERDFIKQVNDIGLAVIAQSNDMVPADKKLYALRDVTATVDNISLIAASIMSKKLASGADAIVLDVKTGSGAFMKDFKDAKSLAGLMVEIGNNLGRRTVARITSMEQPLGMAIGNSLEVKEAIETIKGGGPEDLRELCLALGAEMVVLAGKSSSYEKAVSLLEQNLAGGLVEEVFKKMIIYQKGDPAVLKNPGLLPKARYSFVLKAASSGYITKCDALKIGQATMNLGAGRETRESQIDPGAGIQLHKKLGWKVKQGEPLATLYYNSPAKLEKSAALITEAFEIKDTPVQTGPLLMDRIVK